MEYSFRKIRETDNKAICELIKRSLEKADLAIPGTVYFDEIINHLSDAYGSSNAEYYVLTNEVNNVIGGIGFAKFPDIPGAAELQKLYLDDSAKGQGLGYKMVAYIEERMKEVGFTHSYLETHDNLAAAIHIYKKSGYREIPKPDFVVHSSMTRFFIKDL